jgi:Protein of unknown function (DUF3995)
MTADQHPVSQHRVIAYAAACWAAIFAAFHFVWAAGWYSGLDPVQAQAAFAIPRKLAYDLAAGAMCVVAVPFALALALPWGRHVPRRILLSTDWARIGLLVLRAVAGLIQVLYFVARPCESAIPVRAGRIFGGLSQ